MLFQHNLAELVSVTSPAGWLERSKHVISVGCLGKFSHWLKVFISQALL